MDIESLTGKAGPKRLSPVQRQARKAREEKWREGMRLRGSMTAEDLAAEEERLLAEIAAMLEAQQCGSPTD